MTTESGRGRSRGLLEGISSCRLFTLTVTISVDTWWTHCRLCRLSRPISLKRQSFQVCNVFGAIEGRLPIPALTLTWSHSHLSDNDLAQLDYSVEQTPIQRPTLIQELDLEHYNDRLFIIELLKRCPELRHSRLPLCYKNTESWKLHTLIPIHCIKLEGVHAELDIRSESTLDLALDAVSLYVI